MWDLIKKFVESLEPFESIISIITMIFAGYASFRLMMQNRRLKELARTAPKIENFQDKIKFYEGVQTCNPIALALSLVPQTPSIKKDVEQFLNTMGWKMEVDEINMNGINSQSDIETLINRLREKRHLFDLQGNTEVHLFIQGPVVSGILSGAMFDHWKPVKLYHKSTPSVPAVYQYWCPLIK
ncbi:SAVED domain-containing protein [Candidatus Kuenenia sp.]|uniref:SAVED domain-containing protein n=1 Tax=Candidatus Kuenenia sp. TaxID=2499824 RepID=UPI00321F7676